MKIVILAGGGGTRLFPLSRACFPKQFLKMGQDCSLLSQTIRRFLPMTEPSDMVVVTNEAYLHHVKAELAACRAEKAHILLEPIGRNTAPAIALAMKYCREELGCGDEEILAAVPTDHVVRSAELFNLSLARAVHMAKEGRIATLGVQASSPKTQFGYMEAGEPFMDGYEVRSFTEKPNLAAAEEYAAKGNYYWNCGIYTFMLAVMEREMQAYQPQIAALAEGSYTELHDRFNEMPDISIDYAVAEHSEKVAMVPVNCAWTDIGSWDAIYDILPKDEAGNALVGDCIVSDCKNSLIMGRDRLIAGIGLDDILLVETDDVIVVTKKGESEKVRGLVKELKLRGRKEAGENTTMYRPWGSYTVLGEGPKYKMKKIIVSPGGRLSLQMHYHRSEHWVVVSGIAEVTIGEEVKIVHESESIFIPKTVKHRLCNPGKTDLEIIEVQNGSYLEEDDIVRFEDVYGRA